MSPVLFCHTLKCVWRSSPLTGGDAELSAQRSGIAPRSFQRVLRCTRAVWKTSHYGLYKRTNFWTVKPLYGCCFSSGNEGLFCGTIFPKKPTFSLLEKDVRWKAFLSVLFLWSWACFISHFWTRYYGFYLRTILDVGARKRIQQSASQ